MSEKVIGDVQALLLDVTTEELVAELERRAEAGRLKAAGGAFAKTDSKEA